MGKDAWLCKTDPAWIRAMEEEEAAVCRCERWPLVLSHITLSYHGTWEMLRSDQWILWFHLPGSGARKKVSPVEVEVGLEAPLLCAKTKPWKREKKHALFLHKRGKEVIMILLSPFYRRWNEGTAKANGLVSATKLVGIEGALLMPMPRTRSF